MAKREDLTGRKFGRLTVIGFDRVGETGQLYWKCKCECGNEKSVAGGSLKKGHTKSCGCLKRSKTKQNKGGIYSFQADEIKLKGDYRESNRRDGKIKQYKLSPVELEKYLAELAHKEVQYRGRG